MKATFSNFLVLEQLFQPLRATFWFQSNFQQPFGLRATFSTFQSNFFRFIEHQKVSLLIMVLILPGQPFLAKRVGCGLLFHSCHSNRAICVSVARSLFTLHSIQKLHPSKPFVTKPLNVGNEKRFSLWRNLNVVRVFMRSASSRRNLMNIILIKWIF